MDKSIVLVLGFVIANCLSSPLAADSLWDTGVGTSAKPALLSEDDAPNIWKDGVGNGFQKGARHAGFFAGAGFGTRTFGSRHRHDMALAGVNYGRIISDVKAADTWCEGNWELRGELFSGAEFNPDVKYVVGGAPFLRYLFITETPFVPFFEVGAGLSATDIRKDLSTTFEFNVQGGGGVQWFFREDLAAALQYRWLHISNARIRKPNEGVNTSLFFLGLEWYF